MSPDSWLARRQQAYVDRAAQRMFDRLSASPESFRRSPSTWGAVVFAAVVLLAAGAALLGLAWLSFHADNWLEWVLVGFGWLVVLAMLPRPSSLPADVVLLEETEFPWIHRLVREVAEAVGIRPPDVVGVNTDFNAYVTSFGLRRRTAMVLGLPIWVLETPNERLATIGHELGHLRGRDTLRYTVIGLGLGFLWRAYDLIHPGHHDEWFGMGLRRDFIEDDDGVIEHHLAAMVQKMLAFPFALLWLLGARLASNDSQHSEYLADRRAAAVAGSAALAAAFRVDNVGLNTVVRSAVRRGEDPFDFIATWSAGAGARRHGTVQRDTAHRADATHPPDDLRIALLEKHPVTPGPKRPGQELLHAADTEMTRLRPQLVRRFTDELRTTWM